MATLDLGLMTVLGLPIVAPTPPTPPRLVQAYATDYQTVVAKFSAAMSEAGQGSWALALAAGGGDIVVSSAVHVGDTTTLHLAAPMTPGVQYRLTASALCSDLIGTLIDWRTADFASEQRLDLLSVSATSPTHLVAYFTAAPASVIAGDFVLSSLDTANIPTVIGAGIVGTTVEINLSGPMDSAVRYTLTVDSVVGGAGGERFGNRASAFLSSAIGFPRLSDASCSDRRTVALTFSTTMSAFDGFPTVVPAAGGDPISVSSVTHVVGTNAATVALGSDLQPSVEYRVQVPYGWADMDGNAMASDGRTADFAGPEPTVNLVSAVCSNATLLLTFDRAPAGAVLSLGSYAVASRTGPVGYVPRLLSVERAGTVPAGEFQVQVLLRFADQFSGGEGYRVTVSGIVGPSDEALGTALADFVAASTAPRVLSAAAVGFAGVSVRFSRAMTGIADPAAWALRKTSGGAPVAVSSVGGTAEAPLLGTAALEPETEYTVTAPPAALDGSGTVLDPSHTEAVFRTAAITGTLTLGASGGTVRILAVAVFDRNPERMEVLR